MRIVRYYGSVDERMTSNLIPMNPWRKPFERAPRMESTYLPRTAGGGRRGVVTVRAELYGPGPETLLAHTRKEYELFSCSRVAL